MYYTQPSIQFQHLGCLYQETELHNEELHNLQSSSPSIIIDQLKEDEMSRACGTKGEEEESVWDFGGKPEWKRPLGRLDVIIL
jgi:hypothetical protein